MKKVLILILVLAFVPLLSFAELGVGASAFFNSPVLLGFNAKANADIKLGPLSVGLSYIMVLNLDNGIALDKNTGMLGANVLFWL